MGFPWYLLRGRGQEILWTGIFVVPAKAGTQGQQLKSLGSRFRGNDGWEEC
jgi:hypothetical protein